MYGNITWYDANYYMPIPEKTVVISVGRSCERKLFYICVSTGREYVSVNEGIAFLPHQVSKWAYVDLDDEYTPF